MEDEALTPYVGLNLICFVYFFIIIRKAHKQCLDPTKKHNLNKILVLQGTHNKTILELLPKQSEKSLTMGIHQHICSQINQGS